MLARRQPHLARPLTDALVQDIDLKIGNPEGGHATIRKEPIAWQRNQHQRGGTRSHDELVIRARERAASRPPFPSPPR